MGLFKKFFSIGSRKSKKRSATSPCTKPHPPLQEHFKPSHDDSAEAELTRLLRSSSGRCAPESQISPSSLPPLPHPIDSVIPYPKSSSTTIASVSARSTYSVTIGTRTVHSRTEFPNAYPLMDVTVTPKRSLTDSARRRSKSVPITPRDKNRLLLLRQDPSVASLLDHYNDQGHINSALFSNTPSPQKVERVQRRRTGSTLRQLLGHPSSSELGNNVEGDISWAEKFLGETDATSSVSSIGPQTPVDIHFTHIRSIDDKAVLSIECDTSATNHQTFSSLEVEPSASIDHAESQTLDSPDGSSVTPQRASQIFGFLGEKKRVHDGPVSRLPQLKATTPFNYRRFSAETSISDTTNSHISLPRRSNTCITQPTSSTNQQSLLNACKPSSTRTTAVFSSPHPEGVVSASPRTVISQPQHAGQSSHVPCGPRSPFKIPSRQSAGPPSVPWDFNEYHLVTEHPVSTQTVLGDVSNSEDKCIGVTATRTCEMQSQIPKLRTASGSSSGSTRGSAINHPLRQPVPMGPTVQKKAMLVEEELATGIVPHGKENDVLSRLPLPVTPVRPLGIHSHHLREPPSPAPSSELSPVAKQMMASLREQRIHARQRERRAGRFGGSQSRIRC